MTIKLPFSFGTIVYLRTRTDKQPGMVTGYQISPGGQCVLITWSENGNEYRHYFCELTTEFTPYTDEQPDPPAHPLPD